ncbi:MAG: hypothetical protein HY906_05130 [Deltaproteobacteria bacterium]|nr:hypothetical protein [Deltaproteobacteria bacterium]
MRSRASSSGDRAAPRCRRATGAVLLRDATLAALLALAGCGPTASRPAPRVAIVPVDTVGVPAAEGQALQTALTSALDRSRAARAVPGAAAAAAAASQPAEWTRCRESSACLAGVGRRVPADLVLSLAVAGLGDLRLVRSRLLRADDALPLQDLQETVQGGRPALETYAGSLARRLFPEAARRPWYQQWWFFVAAAGVAGATAAATWAVVRSQRHATGVVHLGDL